MLFNCCNISTEQGPIDDLRAAQCTHDALAPLQNVINDESYIVVRSTHVSGPVAHRPVGDPSSIDNLDD